MSYLPLFLNVENRLCLVVGGGEVALRKVQTLLRWGANIKLLAPSVDEAIYALEKSSGMLSIENRPFCEQDLDQCLLVVVTTDQAELNAHIAGLARSKGILVNVVDSPKLCDFIFPSIVDRSPVVVAVSSSGASPVLARLLRARIEALIPSAYGSLATLLERYREQAKRRFTTIGLRRRFWENVIQGPIAELMLAGHREAAEKALQQSLDENESLTARGEVSLVGAGPGDPDLLTFRALRLLQRADVIVYDRLVSQAILDLARKDAEFVYVGKRRADHAVPQQGINQLLVDLAQQGKRVVRLKGGDPFIFGRGGEEIEELAQAGILFQIVPGITAAAGAASYSGIPLTHRDYAQSVVFVTGHLKDNTVDLDWGAIVRPNQTLVVYMGLVGLAQMCKQLVAHGMGEGTPIAIIEKATTQDQRVITGDLTDIVTKAEQHALRAPTLIIIGEVVRLHHTLRWFETEAATSV